jgi:hypothetical protein
VNNTQLTYIRTGASVILTMLTALLTIYPNEMWSPLIAAAIAGGGVLGIHAIPSVSQGKVTPMSTGPELMGIVPVNTGERQAPVDPEPVAEPVEAEPAPDPAPETEAPQLGATVPADPKPALREVALKLLEAIEYL